MDAIETYRNTRTRQDCCCGSRVYAVRDFPFVYKHVQAIKLPNEQKNLMLSRYVHIMEKVKQQFGCFSGWYTCSKTCLIIGNITVPSIMSVQALLNDDTTARTALFWSVWFMSIIIAIISSFVTFCNTQKKYNLFNQFNTKIQREMWAYLTLTGRYRILRRHRLMMAQYSEQESDRAGSFPASDDPPPPALHRTQTFLFDNEGEGTENPVEPADEGGEAAAVVTEEEALHSPPPSGANANSRLNQLLDNLYAEEEDDEFLNFSNMNAEPRQDNGHIVMFNLFMNRLEQLYRFMTNSNIDIELEDTSLIEEGNQATEAIQTPERPKSISVK